MGREKIDYACMRELYDGGRSDAEIAEIVGCSVWSVAQWRKRNGLILRKRGNGAGEQEPPIPEEQPDMPKYYNDCPPPLTSGDICAILGATDDDAPVIVSGLGCIIGIEITRRMAKTSPPETQVYIITAEKG